MVNLARFQGKEGMERGGGYLLLLLSTIEGGWMEDALSRRIGCTVLLLDHLSLRGSWLVQGFLQN